MEVQLAGVEDIEQLTEMRIAYLKEDFKAEMEKHTQQIKEQLEEYYKSHLGNNILGFIVKNGDQILSTALLLIINKPANPNFITGKVGEVLNVYTRPEYRHQGMAKATMEALLAHARYLKLDYVELIATEDGYPLYSKLGFQEKVFHNRPMKYNIEK